MLPLQFLPFLTPLGTTECSSIFSPLKTQPRPTSSGKISIPFFSSEFHPHSLMIFLFLRFVKLCSSQVVSIAPTRFFLTDHCLVNNDRSRRHHSHPVLRVGRITIGHPEKTLVRGFVIVLFFFVCRQINPR